MKEHNQSFVVYNSDGRILRCIDCPPMLKFVQVKGSEKIVEGIASIDEHMVVNMSIVSRPENPIVVDGTSITNIPIPSTMYLGPDTYELTDSTVDLDLPLSGSYLIRFESFPYKDASFVVEVP